MRDHSPSSHSEPDDATNAEQAARSAGGLDTPETAVPTQPAPEPVHRWLDGESVPDADLHAPDAEKHVKFWARVNEETARRRRQPTPAGLDAIIMDKLSTPISKDD